MQKNIKIFFMFIMLSARAGDFSVATINVLHERFYTFDKRLPRMAFDKRIVAFKKYMPQNTDIICMQEWPYDSSSHDWRKFSSALNEIYPVQNYEQVMANFGKFKAVHGPCIVFNKKKFKQVDGPWTSFFECSAGKNTQGQWASGRLSCPASGTITKACVAVVLESLTNNNEKIGVINVHVPWVQNGFHVDSVNIIKNIVQKNYAVKHWIVCGDFNYDTYKNDASYGLLQKALLNWHSSRDGRKDYTACSVNNDDPMIMDYIFYNNVMPVSTVEVTPSFDALIRHKTTTNQYFKDYFSDHAVVRMEFNIIAQQATVKKAIAAPVVSNKVANKTPSQQSFASAAKQAQQGQASAQVHTKNRLVKQQSARTMGQASRSQNKLFIAWNNFVKYMKSFFKR